jgi:hypothetical protein
MRITGVFPFWVALIKTSFPVRLRSPQVMGMVVAGSDGFPIEFLGVGLGGSVAVEKADSLVSGADDVSAEILMEHAARLNARARWITRKCVFIR